jgi:ribosomal protein S21
MADTKTDNAPGLGSLPKVLDDPTIYVRNADLESALRLLRRRFLQSGVGRILAIRRDSPTAAGRRRAKALRAARHSAQLWARKRAADAREKTR